MNDELTATGRPKGQLLRTPAAKRMLGIGDSTLRALMRSGFGPPAFRMPGIGRWLFWEGELMDFLESNRRQAAAENAERISFRQQNMPDDVPGAATRQGGPGLTPRPPNSADRRSIVRRSPEFRPSK